MAHAPPVGQFDFLRGSAVADDDGAVVAAARSASLPLGAWQLWEDRRASGCGGCGGTWGLVLRIDIVDMPTLLRYSMMDRKTSI